ncbi:alpha/beta-hydrolase [Stipitochalara longipes BDJ]|nr:alpha/beta-hydrolase [Stipitochalara longipes BDJ]
MSALLRSVLLLCGARLALTQNAQPCEGVPTATVLNGTYTGIHSSAYNQDFFLGIPFAQPPIGSLRFRTPVPLNNTWTAPRQAISYSAACVGYGSDDTDYPALSEDCLYLNVIRPSGYIGKSLPIGLWIHGGGYYEGSSLDPRYNLSAIVARSVAIGKPIIGVSINYRLSAWGLISSQEVLQSGQTNLGLRDQRLALHWVQENIAAFGGDPGKVTIWGESAGAGSVGAQLIAYGGRNDKLFRATIVESGGPIQLLPISPNQAAFDLLTQDAGCSSASDKLQCLRVLPFAQLNQILNTTGPLGLLGQVWAPILDDDFIQQKPSVQIKSGNFVRVPVIAGTNSDEGTAFGPTGVDNTTVFFNDLTTWATPAPVPSAFATKVLTAYPDVPSLGIPGSPPLDPNFRPGPPFGAQFRRSCAYYGDASFIAARRLYCETWSKLGLAAYCYRFNTLPAGLPDIIGVTHFQEVAFVFDNTNGAGYAVSPFEGKPATYNSLAKYMSASWASFISDLDPNAWRGEEGMSMTPGWPAYDSRDPKNIVWDGNSTSLAEVEKDDFRADGIQLIIDNLETVYNA